MQNSKGLTRLKGTDSVRPDNVLGMPLITLHSVLLFTQIVLSMWLISSLARVTTLTSALPPVAYQSEVLPKTAVELNLSTPSVGHFYGLNRAMFPPGFKPFDEILKSSQATKKVHRLGHMYGEYLDPLRLQQDEVNMMEIGLQYGASLNLWFSAFPRGRVYGLEYNRLELKAAQGSQVESRAKIYRGDQTNVTLLNEISADVGREVGLLDFIVDDGGHSMEQQIVSFTHLMPLVRPGGVYFIEDLQTSYYSRCHHHWNKEKYCYGGGPPGKKNTTIDLIKSFIDVLNADFMEDHKDQDKLGSGVFSVNPSDKLIGSIQCWRNMCAFRRKFEEHF